jgi:hypothetical protein
MMETPQAQKQDWSWKASSLQLLQADLCTTIVACAVGPSVITSSTDFSFQNLFFWNFLEFSAAEITLKSISPTF